MRWISELRCLPCKPEDEVPSPDHTLPGEGENPLDGVAADLYMCAHILVIVLKLSISGCFLNNLYSSATPPSLL